MSPLYDHVERSWRHLRHVPVRDPASCARAHRRVSRAWREGGPVPWATSQSRFVLLCECLAIAWLKEATPAAVARRVVSLGEPLRGTNRARLSSAIAPCRGSSQVADLVIARGMFAVPARGPLSDRPFESEVPAVRDDDDSRTRVRGGLQCWRPRVVCGRRAADRPFGIVTI